MGIAGSMDWPGNIPAPWSKKHVDLDQAPGPNYHHIIPKVGIRKVRAKRKQERQNKRRR